MNIETKSIDNELSKPRQSVNTILDNNTPEDDDSDSILLHKVYNFNIEIDKRTENSIISQSEIQELEKLFTTQTVKLLNKWKT